MIVSGANLENEINIKADWLNEINQITFVKRGDSILQKILFMFKIRHAVKRALKQGKYDFVYFQGADGSYRDGALQQKRGSLRVEGFSVLGT